MKLSTGIISLDILCGTLACLLVFKLAIRKRRIPPGSHLPPGPTGRFIIGNVSDMPRGPLWVTFDKWAKQYGEIVYISLVGQPIIILNSLQAAQDLLEKRSSIYSDRVHATMLVDLMEWDWNTALLRYGEWWRRHRRIFHQYYRPSVVGKYHDVQIRHTRIFLQRLHESPEEFLSHIRHLAGGIIMEIVYGIKILPKGDPYIEIAEAADAAGSEAAIPGNFLVNFLPFLKYVPEWIPGAGFQRKAREWRVPIHKMRQVPFKAMKDAMAAGIAKPSLAATMLEELSRRTDAPADEELVIRNVAGVSYAGGAGTTVSVLTTFLLAMILYPEVQRKAHSELDIVIGDRLPVFKDQDSLPYVVAVCKEAHRWHPAFPLGVGHRVVKDDLYRDFFIPEGSIVIGNAWTILHDEKLYGPDTKSFNPERFLRAGAVDPIGQFGFGRRICSGRYMADNSIFIAVASILKAFDVTPMRDSNGHEIPVEPAYTLGLLSNPEPFRCAIKPRSESLQNLILHPVDD